MKSVLVIILGLIVLIPVLMVVFRPQIDRWCIRQNKKKGHQTPVHASRKKSTYIHSVFGEMAFVRIADGESYWEGHAFFSPTRTTVEVFVDGDESGVAGGAKEFYEEVQRQYPRIIAEFRPEIDRQCGAFSEERISADFDSAYCLSSVSVAGMKTRKDLVLGFDCLFDETFSVSIELSDWEHGVVIVDS